MKLFPWSFVMSTIRTPRQQTILDFVAKHPMATRDQIQRAVAEHFSKSSKVTLLRDISALLCDGLLEREGVTKGSLYRLTDAAQLLSSVDVNQYFSKPMDERLLRRTVFDFEIFPLLKGLLNEKEKESFALLNETFRKKRDDLTPGLIKKELERITIELAWKSSSIEGNTYTLLETERLLKMNIATQRRSREETLMVLNHKNALNFILEKPSYFRKITPRKIIEIHQLLSDGLDIPNGVRTRIVSINGTNYRPLENSSKIEEALTKLCEVLNRTKNTLERALIATLMISYIQPFEDANKRTGRMLGNAILLSDDYCPMSYRSVDEVEYMKSVLLFYEQQNATYFKELFLTQFTEAVERHFG